LRGISFPISTAISDDMLPRTRVSLGLHQAYVLFRFCLLRAALQIQSYSSIVRLQLEWFKLFLIPQGYLFQ